MDMKKILQAMDGVSTKPVEGSNDMAKFMSIVTEGANPHKVALPVQMAMQHYDTVKSAPVAKKESLLKKYFIETEEVKTEAEELAEAERKEQLKMYASKVAKRVMENRYGNRDAYQRDYDSSRTGFGRQGREDDEYHNGGDPDPEFERNRQETTMYNVTVDGQPVNDAPFLGRSAALHWAKGQVASGALDPKVAKLSTVR